MDHHLFMYHNPRTGKWRGHFPHLRDVLHSTTDDHGDAAAVVMEARTMLKKALETCKLNNADIPRSRPPRDGEYAFDNEPEFGLVKYVTMLA